VPTNIHFFENSPVNSVLAEIKAGETTVLEKLRNPVKFERIGTDGSQSITYGYESTLFIDLCDAIYPYVHQATSKEKRQQGRTAVYQRFCTESPKRRL
jgi:hypothetical protein